MRKISLILIFCFLFHGCVGFSSFFAGSKVGSIVQKNSDKRECAFEEFMMNREYMYALSSGVIGSIVDMGLSIKYFNTVNPTGIKLYFAAHYPFGALVLFALLAYELQIIPFTRQNGWDREDETICEKNYFVIIYNQNDDLKSVEVNFLKAILNYPHNYDISQDQNFTNFQKKILTNNKIQTYYKDNYLYRYIHYSGGKAKFEEDFGKYLYKP